MSSFLIRRRSRNRILSFNSASPSIELFASSYNPEYESRDLDAHADIIRASAGFFYLVY